MVAEMCKLNKQLVKHGHSFSPTDSNGAQIKRCTCNDGLIKCEPLNLNSSVTQIKLLPPIGQQQIGPGANGSGVNKTIEYLRSILGPAAGNLGQIAKVQVAAA